MRISTHQSQQVAIDAMLDQQKKLSTVQDQVATGRRITRPSDDPVAAARVVNLRDTLATAEQQQKNIGAARTRLTMEESVLGNVTSIIQRVRELTVQANNDSLTPEDRGFVAEEVAQLNDELFNIANSTDSSGGFLFSGSKTKFRPFNHSAGSGFDYHGDDGQRFLLIGPERQIATGDSGSKVFRNIKDGNGEFAIFDSERNKGNAIISPGNSTGDFVDGHYAIVFSKKVNPDGSKEFSYKVTDEKGDIIIPEGTPYKSGDAITFKGVNTFIKGEPEEGDFFVVRPSENQDVFTTIDRLVKALRGVNGNSSDHAGLHNEANRALVGLDQALGNILEVRATVGARLNALDGQEEINSSYKLQIKQTLSKVEDLDYSKAVSELNLKLTGLEASQKAFTRVQGISLFNYL
ncbi:Flagellar hook-associated protein FlgL [hydrothermal vent metagenome]|uniref:Flagellar hook-associated protein FlgL n=1 Tax=hydrothermal vent metagenome TaxID=652676 RepID=A0A3B1C6U4_9ZZZZ